MLAQFVGLELEGLARGEPPVPGRSHNFGMLGRADRRPQRVESGAHGIAHRLALIPGREAEFETGLLKLGAHAILRRWLRISPSKRRASKGALNSAAMKLNFGAKCRDDREEARQARIGRRFLKRAGIRVY